MAEQTGAIARTLKTSLDSQTVFLVKAGDLMGDFAVNLMIAGIILALTLWAAGWVSPTDHSEARADLLRTIKRAFDDRGIRLAGRRRRSRRRPSMWPKGNSPKASCVRDATPPCRLAREPRRSGCPRL